MAYQPIRGNAATWAASSTVLADGQPGLSRNADGTDEMRFGDGSHTWSSLPKPLETKIRDSFLPVNAMDPAYGITGTTDNTLGMQAALDAAASGGRNVHFPLRASGQPYMLGGSGHLLKVAAGVKITADRGVVFKVKSSNGNYRSMLGGTTTSTDLSGLVVDGVTFDQNTSGNAVGSVSTLLVEGTQRFCIYAGAGSNIRVTNCLFQNIDGLNVIYAGSSSMKDVRITGCEFDLVGTSPAWHDHSTIYTSCDGATITGNKFRGILGSNGATTAIETHGPNQVVQGNRVDGYKIGANITGITNLGNDGASVTGNTIRNALIGVQLWSQTGTNGGLVDVDVSHNRIHLNRDPWTLASTDHPKGICLAQSATSGGTVANVDGLKITDNQIRFGSFTSSQSNDYLNASGIELVSQTSTVEIQNFDIGDNLIISAIGPAMRIGCIMRRGKIHDNQWVDPSSTSQTLGTPAGFTTFWRSGLCATGNADFYDVQLWGNRTFDTRGTHLLSQAWATSLSTTGQTRCEEWDNSIVCSDGTVLPVSTQTSGKVFPNRPVVPIHQRFKATLYYPIVDKSTAATTDGRMTLIPFTVPVQSSFDRIGCEVTVAGAASTVVRLGVYTDDGRGLPATKILDAGTVAGDAVAAAEITISSTLQPGHYWLAAAPQGGTPTVRTATGNQIGGAGANSLATATGSTTIVGCYMTGVSGALPSSFTLGGFTATPTLVVMRAA